MRRESACRGSVLKAVLWPLHAPGRLCSQGLLLPTLTSGTRVLASLGLSMLLNKVAKVGVTVLPLMVVGWTVSSTLLSMDLGRPGVHACMWPPCQSDRPAAAHLQGGPWPGLEMVPSVSLLRNDSGRDLLPLSVRSRMVETNPEMAHFPRSIECTWNLKTGCPVPVS